MSIFDVYSFGVVSCSTLYRVRGDFPAPEGYAEIDGVDYMTGGEAANSSIVLSRLGLSVKLDGSWLGDDDAGRRTRTFLESNRIDISRLPPRKGVSSVQEVVFAAKGTRTIFGTYCRLHEAMHWNVPDEADITGATVVCLDPFFGAASRRAAEMAAGAGVPVVTVDCRHDDPLLADTSAVVVAESFLRENYAGVRPDELFREYQRSTEGLVLFTFGDREIWYARSAEPVSTFQPFPIEPVDTTGGGDSFRAGVVYGILKGWPDRRTIEFAAAIAAIVCTRFPGVLGAPSLAEVHDFLRAHRV